VLIAAALVLVEEVQIAQLVELNVGAAEEEVAFPMWVMAKGHMSRRPPTSMWVAEVTSMS